jgi:hypothetical protein
MVATLFADMDAPVGGFLGTAKQSEIGKLYGNLVISNIKYKEKNPEGIQRLTPQECEMTFGIVSAVEVDPTDDMEVFFKILSYNRVFALCGWDANDPHYQEFLVWTKKVIPPEEQDHFTGECIVKEKTMTFFLEKMVMNFFKYEFAKEFGEYRFMIEAKHDIKEYANLVDIAKERLLKSCKDEMSSMTIGEISGTSIFEMVNGTNFQGG